MVHEIVIEINFVAADMACYWEFDTRSFPFRRDIHHSRMEVSTTGLVQEPSRARKTGLLHPGYGLDFGT